MGGGPAERFRKLALCKLQMLHMLTQRNVLRGIHGRDVISSVHSR